MFSPPGSFRELNLPETCLYNSEESSIGDGITNTFDILLFLAIVAGIPGLIFGLPIAALVALSFRRQRKLWPEQSVGTTEKWAIGFLVLLGIVVTLFFVTAVGFTA